MQPSALFHYAQELQDQGQWHEAYQGFLSLLKQEPAFSSACEALFFLPGTISLGAQEQSIVQESQQFIQQSARFYNQLGIQLQEQHLRQLAVFAYQKSIQLNPEAPETLNNLGNALRELNAFGDALDCYYQALRLPTPHIGIIHNNIGFTYQTKGDFQQAVSHYQQAIAYKPDLTEAHNNLGNVLQFQGYFNESLTHYQQVLKERPQHAEALNNMGYAYQARGEIETAIDYYRQALAIQPDYNDAKVNLALAWLISGNFEAGWPQYEYRFEKEIYRSRRPSAPSWDGGDLHGKRIIILQEQGFGDTLQMLRYFPLLKAKGATLIVECYPEMQSLLTHCSAIDELVIHQEGKLPDVAYDTHCFLMSLPYQFQTPLESVPPVQEAFMLPQQKLKEWKAWIAPSKKLNVGFAWSGKPQNPWNIVRSCGLDPFLTLTRIPDLTLYSLQKGPQSEAVDWTEVPENIVNLGSQLSDFLETAAAISQMDLIITVDTAIAHLAGTLQKPVWLLLSRAGDWRWLLERPDSPWYSEMTLYRQSDFNQWGPVFERVKADLEHLQLALQAT